MPSNSRNGTVVLADAPGAMARQGQGLPFFIYVTSTFSLRSICGERRWNVAGTGGERPKFLASVRIKRVVQAARLNSAQQTEYTF
jgi:hypothetical protein